MGDTVNTGAIDPCGEPGKKAGLKPREIRICGVCGAKFSVTGHEESCPVCILRGVIGAESVTAEAADLASGTRQSSAETEHGSTTPRFEHYEVMLDKDSKPIELGRGAMGVTYKAFDVGLRCPVALKVVSKKYLGDESAELRFLREARAAATLRHSNVASVLHLGRTGSSYFYAMEFVEGETLEKLVRRSGWLEAKLALEIATQLAAGLAAMHKQKLVHRDIKPSNIMVSSEEGGTVTAKIIDLGLAKPAPDAQPAEAAISIPGAFVGTPEFASPEQFAGVAVDIRSDLYSLGVVLWDMVTGCTPFRGSPIQIMYQHQHAPLPLEQLKGLPQPAVVLLGMLLEKDPAQRFQSPIDLLKAVPAVIRAVKARRTIKHQDLRKAFVQEPPSSGPDKLSAIKVPKRSIAVLPFDTLSHGKANTYFADGIQDEILSTLAKVSQLKVISRTSVMTFRPGANRNLRSIAESLGVANVVEGTVRDWKIAKEILSASTYNELYFGFSPYSWANSLVPRGCHEIWLTALQRGHPVKGSRFGSARDELAQKAEAQPDDASLMSVLGLIDAALGRKQEAIQEARQRLRCSQVLKMLWRVHRSYPNWR
jgi:serine/threonine protein kinase